MPLAGNQSNTLYYISPGGQWTSLEPTQDSALKSILKARVEDNSQDVDEHLDYCMMTFRRNVHSSTEHTPFELMFGRETRILVDVVMGRTKGNQ